MESLTDRGCGFLERQDQRLCVLRHSFESERWRETGPFARVRHRQCVFVPEGRARKGESGTPRYSLITSPGLGVEKDFEHVRIEDLRLCGIVAAFQPIVEIEIQAWRRAESCLCRRALVRRKHTADAVCRLEFPERGSRAYALPRPCHRVADPRDV